MIIIISFLDYIFNFKASKLKFEPDEDVFNNMDAADFDHYIKSQTTSYQVALAGNNIKAQYSVLHNKINMDKTDAKAWMEFIDIQVSFNGHKIKNI